MNKYIIINKTIKSDIIQNGVENVFKTYEEMKSFYYEYIDLLNRLDYKWNIKKYNFGKVIVIE